MMNVDLGQTVLVDVCALRVDDGKGKVSMNWNWMFEYEFGGRFVPCLIVGSERTTFEGLDAVRFDLVLCDGTIAVVFIDASGRILDRSWPGGRPPRAFRRLEKMQHFPLEKMQ